MMITRITLEAFSPQQSFPEDASFLMPNMPNTRMKPDVGDSAGSWGLSASQRLVPIWKADHVSPHPACAEC